MRGPEPTHPVAQLSPTSPNAASHVRSNHHAPDTCATPGTETLPLHLIVLQFFHSDTTWLYHELSSKAGVGVVKEIYPGAVSSTTDSHRAGLINQLYRDGGLCACAHNKYVDQLSIGDGRLSACLAKHRQTPLFRNLIRRGERCAVVGGCLMSAFLPGLPETRGNAANATLPRLLSPASLRRIRHVYGGAGTSTAGPVRVVILVHVRANHVKHALGANLLAEIKSHGADDTSSTLQTPSPRKPPSSARLKAAASKLADASLQMQRVAQQHLDAGSLLAAAFPEARLLRSTYEDNQHNMSAVLQNLWRAAGVVEPQTLAAAHGKENAPSPPAAGGGGVSKRQAEHVAAKLTSHQLAAVESAFEGRAGARGAACLSEMLRSRGPEEFLSARGGYM